jgi:hypothetical protein
MPHFICLTCKTRPHSTESETDPIGNLRPVCGFLLEPASDLGEIVGYRVIETRGSAWHSGASRAGQLVAGRVGGMIARRELKHARIRPESERCDARSVSPQVQAVSSRALGTGEDAVRRRRRVPTTAEPPRGPRVLGAFDDGRHRRERRRQTKFALRPRPSWLARREMGSTRATKTTPPSVPPTRTSRSTCSWSASHAPTSPLSHAA